MVGPYLPQGTQNAGLELLDKIPCLVGIEGLLLGQHVAVGYQVIVGVQGRAGHPPGQRRGLAAPGALTTVEGAGRRVSGLVRRQPTLEDAFVKLVGRSMTEEED